MAQKTCHSTAETLLFMTMQNLDYFFWYTLYNGKRGAAIFESKHSMRKIMRSWPKIVKYIFVLLSHGYQFLDVDNCPKSTFWNNFASLLYCCNNVWFYVCSVCAYVFQQDYACNSNVWPLLCLKPQRERDKTCFCCKHVNDMLRISGMICNCFGDIINIPIYLITDHKYSALFSCRKHVF